MKGATSSVGEICRLTAFIIALAALSACGGSSSKKFTIGGTVSGLAGTVVLSNNGGDNLSRNANGSFTFASKVEKGKPYSVTVATQPAGQTCVVTNGSGTASANVTNVTVACTTNPTFNVGGTVSGLTGTVVLRNNGGDDLSVSADGSFTFAAKVPSGASYAVTVFTQPTGQTCAVAQGAGTMPSANVTNVAVTCTNNPPPPTTFTIGGNVTGLTGTVVLRNNGADNHSISTNGPFTFPTSVAAGSTYNVTVFTQPAGQNCAVTNGAGTANANVTTVVVNCVAAAANYTIGGTISGLTGAGLKIENGSANAATPAAAATTFTLPNPVGNNFEYDVGISAQPAGQTCVIRKSHGVVNAANVTNVDVICIANVTSPLVGTYTVPALVPGSYVYITFFADGVYIYGSIEDDPPCDAINNGNGVEYGVYNYNAGTGAFTIKSAVVDTNGKCGVWDNGARYTGTLAVGGTAGQGRVLTLTLPGGAGQFDLVPVDSTSGQIVGSFAFPYEKNFGVFLPAGGNNLYYMLTETQEDNPPTDTGYLAGVEYACASVTALTGGTLTPDLTATCQAPTPTTPGARDTSGTSGLSNAGGSVTFAMGADTLTVNDVVYTRIKPN
jgi:hypothetical protein